MTLLKYNELRCVFFQRICELNGISKEHSPFRTPLYPFKSLWMFFPRNHFYYRLQLPIDEVGQSINTLNDTKLQGEECPL